MLKIIAPLLLFLVLLTACNQEKYVFHPKVLSKDYKFDFKNNFRELNIQVEDDTYINGLLFLSDSARGLVFYLHGNAGALDSWGHIADLYTENLYDCFILDYRGYGKSDGDIESEKQLLNDVQIVYDSLKQNYNEKDITIIGFSIGTGIAAHLTSNNKPKQLILKAPYYSLLDLSKHYVKIVPSSFVKYTLRTDEFIQNVKCPITIFHGTDDEVIYYGSSLKLKKLFKEGDTLISLEGQKHNGINSNPIYRNEIRRILNTRTVK